MDINNPLPYSDNDIYEFFINHYSPLYGVNPSIINNRSIMSFVIFNVPDNDTLIGQDTDNDDLNDYIELFVTYTSPFMSDTDNDGASDYYEHVEGSDPNNYTDKAEINVPILSMESPGNGSTGQLLNPTLLITVTHPINATMNVTFRTNASESWADIGTNQSVHNGTYSHIPSNIDSYGKKYFWSVNCSDGMFWTNETYYFTTEAAPNNAPLSYNENPSDGSINISINPTMNVTVDDADNDVLSAYWYSNSSGGWDLFAINSSIDTSNGAVNIMQINSNFSSYSTTYYWSVNVTDGTVWTNKTYWFTTENDSEPPKIINVVDYPDPQEIGGYINISCDVTDMAGVGTVMVNITYPDNSFHNETMVGGSYYYNASYSMNGTYYYFIWANDTNGNANNSATYSFDVIETLFVNYSVSLSHGWNLISLPVNQSINKANLTINYLSVNYSWDQAVDNNTVLQFVYGWDTDDQNYVFADVLNSGEGHWLYAYEECILKREIEE